MKFVKLKSYSKSNQSFIIEKTKEKEMRNIRNILTSHNKPEKDQTPFTRIVMVAEGQVRFSENQQICSKHL